LYRHLHQNPELSFKEVKTAARLSEEVEKIGFEVTRNVGGNSFVGILKNGKGPVVMIRTDMDALPLEEKTGLPFASKVIMEDAEGNKMPVMHACGHDMHMTVWLGIATVLAQKKDLWSGTLMIIAQQAEEKTGGAVAMLKDGLYSRFPVPDYALAYHVNAEMPAGTIGYRQGAFMAGVNSVDVIIYGMGGHGAMPHRTIDPVVLASRFVLALQTIRSREINPLEPAVISVGSIHGGTVHNIIPDQVKLQLTVRYFSDEIYTQIMNSLERISVGIAKSAGIDESKYPEVIPLEGLTPPVINESNLTAKVVSSYKKILGEEQVIEVQPITVGEDFALYGRTEENVPIAMFWLGSVDPMKYEKHIKNGLILPGLHNPEYYPHFDLTYTTGVKAMSHAVIDLYEE
ncbi:amidohydrolase, partial [Bacteroidota bacterium]